MNEKSYHQIIGDNIAEITMQQLFQVKH